MDERTVHVGVVRISRIKVRVNGIIFDDRFFTQSLDEPFPNTANYTTVCVRVCTSVAVHCFSKDVDGGIQLYVVGSIRSTNAYPRVKCSTEKYIRV